MNANNVYVIYAKRTAVGSFLGSLQNTSAAELASKLVENFLATSKIAPEKVNELILGNVLSAGLGQNVARQVVIKAGLSEDICAFSVNKVCGSGMKALELAYQSIALGDNDLVIAGGSENMSQSPYLLPKARTGLRMGDSSVVDSMIKDGLWCAMNDYHMGITAENIAEKYGISKQEQDAFAYESQRRAGQAIKDEKFKEEILPVDVKKGKETVSFDTDEFVRFDASLEKISGLKPVFKKDGTVTPANASGVNDGAAILVLASEKFVKENALKPIAKIVGFASAGVDPKIMGMGPEGAVKKVLAKTSVKLEEIDLFEFNEAFAVQSLGVLKALGLENKTDKINVNGGAIAIGHPIGASGARIVVTLLHEMNKRKDAKTGLASLCIGGGMGIAAILEKC